MAEQVIITLAGLGVFDGEYPMPTDLDMGELFFIEKETGIRAGEVNDALKAGSVGVLACAAAIAVKRAGRGEIPMESLWAAKDDNIDVEKREVAAEPEEDEQRPPDSATSGGQPSEPDAVA